MDPEESKNKSNFTNNIVFQELLKHKPFMKGCDSIIDDCLNDFNKIKVYIETLKNIKDKNEKFEQEINRHQKKWKLKNLNKIYYYIDKLNIENLKKACIIHNKIYDLYNKYNHLKIIFDDYHFINHKLKNLFNIKRNFSSFFSDIIDDYNFLDYYKETIGYTRIANLFDAYCINMHDFIPKIHRYGVSVSEYDKDYVNVINELFINENMFFVYRFHDYNLPFSMTIKEFMYEYIYKKAL